MAQAPTLTDFDRRVLDRTPLEVGMREPQIARSVFGRKPSDRELREIHLTLRGLEHFKLVTGSGGWWRRIEQPEPEQMTLGASR